MAQSPTVGTCLDSKIPACVDDNDLAPVTSPEPASKEHVGTNKDLTGKVVSETAADQVAEPLMHQTRDNDSSNTMDETNVEMHSPVKLNEITDGILNIEIGPSTSRRKSLNQMSGNELQQMATDNLGSLETVKEGAAAIVTIDSDNDEEPLDPLTTVKSDKDNVDPKRTKAVEPKEQQPEPEMPAFLVPPPHMIRGLLAEDFLERIRIWSPYFWQFPEEISMKTLSDGKSVLIPHTNHALAALNHPMKYGNADIFCLMMINARQFEINNIPSQFSDHAQPNDNKENMVTSGNSAKSRRPHKKHNKLPPEHKMPAFLVPPPRIIRGLLANDFLDRILFWNTGFSRYSKDISIKTLSNGQSILVPHTNYALDVLKHPVKYGPSHSMSLIMIKAMQFKISNIPLQFKPCHFTHDKRVQKCCNLQTNNNKSWAAIFYSYEHIDCIRVSKRKSFKAYDYKPGPNRCTKCQKFGHQKYRCKSKTAICAFCAEKHDSSVCFEQNKAGKPVIYKCANCQGDHMATSHDCPKFLQQCPKVTGPIQLRPVDFEGATSLVAY